MYANSTKTYYRHSSYNFGPKMGQSEHYFLNTDGTMYMF